MEKNKFRFLIVEDDPIVAQHTIKGLKRNFAECHTEQSQTTTRGQDYLADPIPYHVLIIDLSIAVRSKKTGFQSAGLTAIDEIRQKHPLLYIIIYTYATEEEVRDNIEMDSRMFYVEKFGIEEDDMITVLDSILNNTIING